MKSNGFLKRNKKKSSRQEIGAKLIDDNGVETYKKEYIIYFLIKPLNIAVLSESNIRGKILALMNLLKEIERIEIACINSRESFEANKLFFRERLSVERNAKVRELLEKDAAFLDRIQIQTASAREFLMIMRMKENEVETVDVNNLIGRIEKMLKEQGFIVKKAGKEDIKRIFSVYFIQNLTQVYFDDYDGEKWLTGGEFNV